MWDKELILHTLLPSMPRMLINAFNGTLDPGQYLKFKPLSLRGYDTDYQFHTNTKRTGRH